MLRVISNLTPERRLKLKQDQKLKKGKIHSTARLHKLGLRYLHTYTQREIEKRLKSYFKFMFVRNPLERVLSAYRNKMEKRPQDFKPIYKNRILRHKYPNMTLAELEKTNHVEFQDFVDYLIRSWNTVKFVDPSVREEHGGYINHPTREQKLLYPYKSEVGLNRHWDTYSHSCLPCEIKYDFIGKLETFSSDIVAIMKGFGNEGCSNLFPSLFKTSTSSSVHEDYFKNLTQKQIHDLAQIYANDFELYEYDSP